MTRNMRQKRVVFQVGLERGLATDGRSPLEVARELQQQAADGASALRAGDQTSNVKALRVWLRQDPTLPQAPHTPAVTAGNSHDVWPRPSPFANADGREAGNKVEELKVRMARAQEQLAEKTIELETLSNHPGWGQAEAGAAAVQAALSETADVLARKDAEIAELKMQLAKSERDFQDLMNAHGRSAGTIDSLRTELAEVEKAKDTQIKELMTHLSRVDAKLAAELEKEAQIGESLAEERRKAEELERSLSEQTRSLAATKEMLQRDEEELARDREMFASKDKETASLRREVDALQAAKGDIDTALANARQDYADMQRKAAANDDLIASLQQQVAALRQSRDEATATADGLREQLEELQKLYAPCPDTIAGLEGEVKERGERIRQQGGEIEALQLKVSDLKGHLTRLDHQLAAELEKEEVLQLRLAEEQRKERQLEASLAEERRKEAELQESLAEEKRKEADLERALHEEQRKEAALESAMQQQSAEERLRDLRRAETLKASKLVDLATNRKRRAARAAVRAWQLLACAGVSGRRARAVAWFECRVLRRTGGGVLVTWLAQVRAQRHGAYQLRVALQVERSASSRSLRRVVRAWRQLADGAAIMRGLGLRGARGDRKRVREVARRALVRWQQLHARRVWLLRTQGHLRRRQDQVCLAGVYRFWAASNLEEARAKRRQAVLTVRLRQRWRSADATRLLHTFWAWDNVVAGGAAERNILSAHQEREEKHAMAMAALRQESDRERDEIAARLQAQVAAAEKRMQQLDEVVEVQRQMIDCKPITTPVPREQISCSMQKVAEETSNGVGGGGGGGGEKVTKKGGRKSSLFGREVGLVESNEAHGAGGEAGSEEEGKWGLIALERANAESNSLKKTLGDLEGELRSLKAQLSVNAQEMMELETQKGELEERAAKQEKAHREKVLETKRAAHEEAEALKRKIEELERLGNDQEMEIGQLRTQVGSLLEQEGKRQQEEAQKFAQLSLEARVLSARIEGLQDEQLSSAQEGERDKRVLRQRVESLEEDLRLRDEELAASALAIAELQARFDSLHAELLQARLHAEQLQDQSELQARVLKARIDFLEEAACRSALPQPTPQQPLPAPSADSPMIIGNLGLQGLGREVGHATPRGSWGTFVPRGRAAQDDHGSLHEEGQQQGTSPPAPLPPSWPSAYSGAGTPGDLHDLEDPTRVPSSCR